MPIITVTSNEALPSGTNASFRRDMFNDANALAKAIGTTPKQIDEPYGWTDKPIFYYVPIDSIGFPGLCATFHFGVDDGYKTYEYGIYKTDLSSGEPDLSDPAAIRRELSGSQIYHASAVTCVMVYDEAKDTVLFDIHPGTTTHSSDRGYLSDRSTLFFAKDVNGGILCGLGRDNIQKIRTEDHSSSFSSGLPANHEGLTGILHLTKMINYLDPSHPEMKSAYVSILRPYIYTAENRRVGLYELNGVKWGCVGDTDWSNATNKSDSSKLCCFAIDPFVKY